MPRDGGPFSEFDFAFWVQFAGIWKRLAEMSNDAHRRAYLEMARACLLRAETVREILSQTTPPSKLTNCAEVPVNPATQI